MSKYLSQNWRVFFKDSDILFTVFNRVKSFNWKLSSFSKLNGGLTTGNDNYFYIDNEIIDKFQIDSSDVYPVIRTQKDLKLLGILGSDKYLFSCKTHPNNIRDSKSYRYIEHGIAQNINRGKALDTMWYYQPAQPSAILIPRSTYNRFGVHLNPNAILFDNWACGVKHDFYIFAYLNSIVNIYLMEVLGNSARGEGIRTFSLSMLANLPIVYTKELKSEFHELFPEKDIVQLVTNDLRALTEEECYKPSSIVERVDDFFINAIGGEVKEYEIRKEVSHLAKLRIRKADSLKVK